MIFFEKQVR